MKELALNITYYKMLDTIRHLNKDHLYPLPEGVYKILTGVVDEETVNYMHSPTFATLVSFSSKKVCRYLMMLQRYGYIRKVYDEKTNNLYLEITQLGEDACQAFHQRHRLQYPKRKKDIKKTIVEIHK